MDKYSAIEYKTVGIASADIAKYLAVARDGDLPGVEGEGVIGVTDHDFETGDTLSVISYGQAFITLGGTVTAGMKLYADAAQPGRAINIALPAGEVPFAIALEAGDDGDVIKCEVFKYGVVGA